MYLPCWSSFLQKVELHRKTNCQLDVRLRATCMMRDVDWPETKFSWSLGFLRTQTRQVYIEREELTILLRVVLLLLVRLYLIFGYITSQKAVKLPSMKVFCEMREGNLIGVDTNEAAH